jgi:hypothetical protein
MRLSFDEILNAVFCFTKKIMRTDINRAALSKDTDVCNDSYELMDVCIFFLSKAIPLTGRGGL